MNGKLILNIVIAILISNAIMAFIATGIISSLFWQEPTESIQQRIDKINKEHEEFINRERERVLKIQEEVDSIMLDGQKSIEKYER